MTHSSVLFVARVNFDHQLFEMATNLKYLGAKWLPVKKVNFTPWVFNMPYLKNEHSNPPPPFFGFWGKNDLFKDHLNYFMVSCKKNGNILSVDFLK